MFLTRHLSQTRGAPNSINRGQKPCRGTLFSVGTYRQHDACGVITPFASIKTTFACCSIISSLVDRAPSTAGNSSPGGCSSYPSAVISHLPKLKPSSLAIFRLLSCLRRRIHVPYNSVCMRACVCVCVCVGGVCVALQQEDFRKGADQSNHGIPADTICKHVTSLKNCSSFPAT